MSNTIEKDLNTALLDPGTHQDAQSEKTNDSKTALYEKLLAQLAPKDWRPNLQISPQSIEMHERINETVTSLSPDRRPSSESS